MVVQNAIDNLKDQPHEDKKAVAGGIAVAVVIVLLIGWGFFFLRKIQKGATPTLQGTAVPSDQFNAQFLQETQKQLNEMYQSSSDDLRTIRDTSAENEAGTNYGADASGEANIDGFGTE